MIENRKKRWRFILGVIAVFVLTVSPTALAVDGAEDIAKEAASEPKSLGNGLIAVGAALAIGLSALATGIAQARIGAAGIGAIAENPRRLGAVIMLVAIPETVAILGFVIAYLILSS